jgi:hypothetical protein
MTVCDEELPFEIEPALLKRKRFAPAAGTRKTCVGGMLLHGIKDERYITGCVDLIRRPCIK